MHLQDLVHRITEGAGERIARALTCLLCFVALTLAYDLRGYKTLTSQEAMDTAQLARNIAEGRGYTTLSLKPFDLGMLQRHAGEGKTFTERRLPEISTPPAYPALMALVFKVGAFRCGSGRSVAPWDLEPWIMGLNQVLFFIAAMLLFKTASRLFDRSVAWLATGVFVATDLMWQFSVSGLSTMLLIIFFLLIVQALERLDRLVNAPIAERRSGVGVCLAMGMVLGLGALTRYSFAWMALPILIFILMSVSEGRAKLCIAVCATFLAVLIPWLVRNYTVTGYLFGSAAYNVFQSTYPLPADTLQRSIDAKMALDRIDATDFADKLLTNLRSILSHDLPRLGGNWLSAFFLVGLLVPFRKAVLSKLRLFTLGALLIMMVIQALGQTHLSDDSPILNSDNLLVIFTPIIFVFGAALFFTLFEQLDTSSPTVRTAAVGVFATTLCAPFILFFLTPQPPPPIVYEAFNPAYIQRVVNWTGEDELMISDVPSAVAWYGDQTCSELPLDCREQFQLLNRIKPVRALYLTQRTTANFMSQSAKNPGSWEKFALDDWARGVVPDGFPLTKEPTGLLPERIFLSASNRWVSSQK